MMRLTSAVSLSEALAAASRSSSQAAASGTGPGVSSSPTPSSDWVRKTWTFRMRSPRSRRESSSSGTRVQPASSAAAQISAKTAWYLPTLAPGQHAPTASIDNDLPASTELRVARLVREHPCQHLLAVKRPNNFQVRTSQAGPRHAQLFGADQRRGRLTDARLHARRNSCGLLVDRHDPTSHSVEG